MRIVLVEDNENLGRYTLKTLEDEGYAVDWKKRGESAEQSVRNNPPDLLILDRMLPGKDGVAVCKALRAADVNIPILMLTALGEIEDRVEGLDSGADDYLVKPFEMEELLARVRALLRRPPERVHEILTVRDVSLSLADRTITKGNASISLTLKEFAILEYLMRNVDQVLSRAQILEHCWEFDYNPFSNIVDVYIRQLRKKIDDDHESYIKTVRGAGYRLAR